MKVIDLIDQLSKLQLDKDLVISDSYYKTIKPSFTIQEGYLVQLIVNTKAYSERFFQDRQEADEYIAQQKEAFPEAGTEYRVKYAYAIELD